MHRHVLTIALAASLCAFGAQAAPPRHKTRPAHPASSAQAAAPSPEEKARIAALVQYQRDLVTVNALRSDAVHLLGAALLARPLPDQKPELTFHRLAERAAAAPDAGPGVTWLRLADCDSDANCPNAAMLKKLQTQAADNAAVWMLVMDEAAQKNDDAGVRAALAKAAAAKSYDDYFGIGLQGAASVVGTLSPLPATMQGTQPGEPKTAAGVELLIAFGVANQHPRPSLKPLLDSCDAGRAGKDDALKSDCLKVAHALEWGSSPIGRAVGLHIHGELEPSAKASTDKDARDLAWQMQNYGVLGIKALGDDALAGPLLQAARSGGTELSLVLSTLRASGVSTEAPSDWQPQRAQPAPTASSAGP